MTKSTEWKSDWTADDPIAIDYSFLGRDEGAWVEGDRPYLHYRDLGLAEASGGMLSAKHIRVNGKVDATSDWHYHDLDFQWFYIISGFVRLRTEDRQEMTLSKGDGGYQPPYWRHQEYDFSSDFEVLEVTGPASVETVSGKSARKPERAQLFSHLTGIYNLDRPESYVTGDGPRAFFEYRDFKTSEATDGRIHIHIVKSIGEAIEGGTGRHHHSMSQWAYPLTGWADVEVDGYQQRRMYPGDFMTLKAGMIHNVPNYSNDYSTLEFCVPAEYTTDGD